jgi:hypothetical protein
MKTAELIIAAFSGNTPVHLGAISGAELKQALEILKMRRKRK